ncbi:MAG TPA: dolichyl-phosphate beta-glucosyltransferase [Candidatus Bathyarchaeia archaeon]|nr:dolichyl-phosphate beta-glucosyltransferase [Candidatus Bathyarchaeia archaeon]
MSGPTPRWSVVIPAYNEAFRLPAYLKEVQAYFEGRDEPYEVVVVDDGSRDGTAERVREVAAGRASVRVHSLARNRGKGHAVRAGMERAIGSLRLMADADGATPIAEVARLEAEVVAGADLAVGSRVLADPSVVRRVRVHRKLSGHVFNFLVRRLGVASVVDTQCGFKLFRAQVAETLFPLVATDGFGFDVELLMLAERRGYRIAEVPVNWADQPGSKVVVLREGPRMLLEVAAARWRMARRGRGGRA